MLVGLKHAIGAGGYDLLLFATERPGNGYGDHSYLKRARHHNVDGVVLMGVDPEDAEVRRLVRSDAALRRRRRRARRARAPSSSMSDNESGIALAVRHLHELGHRRIATITGLLDTAPGRRAPARLPRRGAGASASPTATSTSPTETSTSTAGTARWPSLLALPEPPTAVVAASDLMALGAIRAAAEAGLQRAATTSRSSASTTSSSPATSIRRSPRCARTRSAWAAEAGRALIALIDGEGDAPDAVTLPVELVVRGSTTAPPAGA